MSYAIDNVTSGSIDIPKCIKASQEKYIPFVINAIKAMSIAAPPTRSKSRPLVKTAHNSRTFLYIIEVMV